MADKPHHTFSDDQLAVQLRSSDVASLEVLYDRYAGVLFGMIMKKVKNEEVAESVLVDSFTRIWQQAGNYNPARGPLLTWMISICHNLVQDQAEAWEETNLQPGTGHTAGSIFKPRQISLKYITENAILPRPKLKEKVLHRLADRQGPMASPDSGQPLVNNGPEINFLQKKRDKYKWLMALCFTLFILSSILNFYFYQRWKRTKLKLVDARTEQVRLSNNVNAGQQKIAQLQTAVVVLEDDHMKRVKLAGQQKSPGSLAMVHYNAKTNQVFLELKQLPLPPDGKQYQLWALDKGKPVNAGLVETTISLEGMQQMHPVKQARSFLITLEPLGGSTEPDLDQLYLMGKF